MKELEIDLSSALTKGLRADVFQTDELQLVECFNAVPEDWGVRPYERPADAILEVPETDWPFPRVFVSGEVIYLATKDTLYKVNGDWSLTSLTSANQLRDMADFGDYVVFSGYNQVIVKDTELVTYGPILADASFPEFRTCCNFNGQLVIGYIESSWHGCGSSDVGWSNIGAADFTLGAGNEAGFRRVHWNKTVWRVMKLGETVMVYGDNGVGQLFPHEQTFGYKGIMNLGLYSEWAVVGDEFSHHFIDSSGDLWMVEDKQKPKKLGYKEYLSQLTAANTTAIKDIRNGRVYFSDGVKTFVYCDNGLFEVGILPTTIFSIDQYLVGCFSVIDDDDLDYQDDDMVVTFDTLQPTIRSMKTVTEFLVEAYADAGYLYTGAYYKYSNEAMTATDWERANEQGRQRIQITAPDIQLRIRLKNYVTDDRITRATARLQYPDGRYRRGIENAS
jgi:hypothetical protein